MRPIVDGLQAEFDGRAAFVFLDARDGHTGQFAFDQLGLVGHPAVVLFDAAGRENYRSYGLLTAAEVRVGLDAMFNSS